MIAPEHKSEASSDAAAARAFGPTQRFGKSGRLTARIPLKAFMRAVNNNGGVDSKGRNCWDDPGFVADMKRHHPHIATSEGGRIFVGAHGTGGKIRNRFGVVKERIYYS